MNPLNTNTQENMTNLMFAAAAGKVESVKFLVEATPLGRQGAEGLDAAMEDGTTALFHACWRGHTDCVRWVKSYVR